MNETIPWITAHAWMNKMDDWMNGWNDEYIDEYISDSETPLMVANTN